jgi:hypothetical protein
VSSAVQPPDLPSLADVEAHVPLDVAPRCIFVSGSLVLGWGHATSDVDLFVITVEPRAGEVTEVQHDVDVEPAGVPVLIRFVDNRRWDIEFWLDTQVRQLIARCTDVPADRAHAVHLTNHEVQLLYRLRSGVALSGPDWLAETQALLARSKLNMLQVERSLYLADACLDDAAGALKSGDLPTAVLAIREGFDHVVDALTIGAGRVTPGRKWRARNFRQARPAALGWDEYWSRQTMRDYDPGNPGAWVREMLDRCRELILQIEIE